MVILLIALSLSMDAFSLSLIYGMYKLSKKEEFSLSLIVGIFHFIMPLLGNNFGILILTIIPIKLNILVTLIFLIIGIQMILDSFKEENYTKIVSIFGNILFGLAVSIDSFGVGIGLKYISSNIYISSIIFSIVSFSLTYIGLIFGKKIGKKIGKISNIIGGTILIIIGLSYIFK